MTPFPVWLHVFAGLALGLLGLRLFAVWARGRGSWLLVAAVGATAAGIDALLLLVQRTSEAERALPAAIPVALVAALALARIVREWRGLGGGSARASEKTSRTS